MSVIDSLTKKVSSTYKAAAKRSGEIIEITKISLIIDGEKEDILELYSQIGKTVYQNNFFGDTAPESVQSQFDKIKVKEEAIQNLKNKILDLKGVRICNSCELEVELEMSFCPSCGTKQEEIPKIAQDKTCSKCNCVNRLDFLFCSKCGSQFE